MAVLYTYINIYILYLYSLVTSWQYSLVFSYIPWFYCFHWQPKEFNKKFRGSDDFKASVAEDKIESFGKVLQKFFDTEREDYKKLGGGNVQYILQFVHPGNRGRFPILTTPWKINMEAKHHPIDKRESSSKPPWLGSMLFFFQSFIFFRWLGKKKQPPGRMPLPRFLTTTTWWRKLVRCRCVDSCWDRCFPWWQIDSWIFWDQVWFGYPPWN